MQLSRLIAVAACVMAARAHAQAIASGPLVLLLPASTRATALGNAWVAGRDEYSLFYNPAQIAATNGIGTSFARYGTGAVMGALSGGVTVGTLTYGWGVQLVEFKASANALYPFEPADLTTHGDNSALSFVAATGANYVYKGFRTGIGIKFAEDRVSGSGFNAVSPGKHSLVLGDIGVSHPLLSGTAAIAVQNIGDGGHVRVPLQSSLGWARQTQARQFDLAFATQILQRGDWFAPAGGIEVGYGWIEGYSAALRLGAHRPETSAQHPITMGGRFTGDRLTLDYALEFFAQQHYAHHLSIRWQ